MSQNVPESLRKVIEEYHRAQINVMPLKSKGKEPVIEKWNSLPFASLEETLNRFRGRSKCNIGGICGSSSHGVICGDIDANVEAWKSQPLAQKILEQTPVVKTGKGLHIWMLCPEQTKTYIWQMNGQKSGEVRSNGAQVVVPPSIHPSGMPYQLISGSFFNIYQIQPDELLELFPPTQEAKRGRPKGSPNRFPKKSQYVYGSVRWGDFFRDRGEVVAEYGDRLEVICPNAAQHSNPNANTANVHVNLDGSGRHGFHCFHNHCENLSYQQLEAFFGDALDGYGDPFEPESHKATKESIEKILQRRQDEVQEPEPEIQQDLPEVNLRLYQFPGLVGELADWICLTADRPQPILALGGSLALLGSVLGQRVASATDARTNLYVLGLGETGSGKDHILKCLDRILLSANLESLITGNDFTSETALIKATLREPTSLVMMDEIGEILKGILGAHTQSHVAKISKVLMEFYSSANRAYRSKEYASEKENPRFQIEQPCLSLYGTTTPTSFYKLLEKEHVESGLLNRLLPFEAHTHAPEINFHPDDSSAVPDRFVRLLTELRERSTNVNSQQAIASLNVRPAVLPFAKDTEEFWKEISLETYQKQVEQIPYYQMWVRGPLNAQKLALVTATAAGLREMPLNILQQCWALIQDQIELVLRHFAAGTGKLDEGYTGKILDYIRHAGSNGRSLSDVSRRFRTVQKWERDQILETLVEAQLVRVGVTDGKTNTTTRIYANK